MKTINLLKNILKRISSSINIFSSVLITIFLSAMVIIVLLQVFYRFVLNNALPWPEEISRYLMIWITFLGSGIACKYGEHIGVNFIRNKIQKKYQFIIQSTINCCILIFLAFCIWKGLILFKYTSNQLSPASRISMAWAYASVPIGCAIMFIHILNSFFEKQTNPTVSTGI